MGAARRPWPVVLGLALLLPAALGEDALIRPDGGFESTEITVPVPVPDPVEARRPGGAAGPPAAYALRLGGRECVLRLRPRRPPLPRLLPVVHFAERGEPVEDYASLPGDCHLAGSVDGALDSGATVSTCAGGLRGVVRLGSDHYQIQPLGGAGPEHVVRRLRRVAADPRGCGLPGGPGRAGAPPPAPPRGAPGDYFAAYKHPRSLDLVLVFDRDRLGMAHGNLSRVVTDAALLTAIVDTYFQDVGLRVRLAGLELWSGRNRIDVGPGSLADVLGRFLLYRASSLQRRLPGDWAHLYVSRAYADARAWSWGRVCAGPRAGSVSTLADADVLTAATWTAHALGHAVGMAHDRAPCRCRGGDGGCVMGAGRAGFSDCSYGDYLAFVSRGAACLTTAPRPVAASPAPPGPRCGNKVVEGWEQCDCGSAGECQRDPCCQHSCRLAPGAACSSGLCCRRCRLRPAGHLCREEESECDLPEYCDGASPRCPADTYKLDGTPCHHGGQCFGKACRSRYMQCQSLFGPGARDAPRRCYEAVNVVGDQYGNCEIRGVASYRACPRADAVCGRLQCVGVGGVPVLPEHTVVIATRLPDDNLVCWGTGYHLAMRPLGIPDAGAVLDGAHCGDQRVCVGRTCVNRTALAGCACNGRGVCNSARHCHCVYGWAPPFCEERGFGGSVDSGPPGPTEAALSSNVQAALLLLLRLVLFAVTVLVALSQKAILQCFSP
ncbi:disintegrin and metalloproteinase domain-containing protein 30 [Dipodomys merriami]|uniref:disintegrin and metalloproteinase domain-containing protein 30 n=1 Tax=Dipodomys merriami TaxID=94247 RepID=UPI0038558750